MESKQDYFRSPHTRNLANFYSPFKQLKNEQRQDELFGNNLFSPFRRNTNSPFHLYTPNNQQIDEQEEDQFEQGEVKRQRSKVISGRINFQQNMESNNLQLSLAEHSEYRQMPIIMTPQKEKRLITDDNIQTTSRKKYQLRDYDINQKSHLIKDPEKGLRGLSKQAFQVLKNNEPMTYQEVAQKMIQQSDEIGQNSKKQGQSIKRRVYDALNVLIAVGLLTKTGKKIAYQSRKKSEGRKNIQIKRAIEQKIERKKEQIEKKREQISRFKQQYNSLSRLINRNQNCQEQHASEHKIYFPFIIGTGLQDQSHPTRVSINQFCCGDVDAIRKIDYITNL